MTTITAMIGMFIFLCRIWAVEATRSEPIPIYMDEMLNAGRKVYDKQSPPVQAEGQPMHGVLHSTDQPTVVGLAMYIEGMSSFRTQTMDFQLDVYFQQFWRDPRLAHNESRRVLIRDKALLDKMWHPDVYFANARIAEFHEVTQPNFLVWIEPNGSILYDTRVSMIEWKGPDPITRNPNIAMSDMRIVDLYPGLCDGNYSTGIWSCVTAEFFVKREITHHLMQSYVPTTLIVVISWFVFGVMIEFTIVNYAQRQGRKWHTKDADLVMASSLESVVEKSGKAKEHAGSISVRARDFLDRFKGQREHQQLIETEFDRFGPRSDSRLSNCSSDNDDDQRRPLRSAATDRAPPLAANNNVDCVKPILATDIFRDREAEKVSLYRLSCKLQAERLANWALFDDSSGQICNKRSPSTQSRLVPNGHSENNQNATTYGSTDDASKPRAGDKWTSTIKQLQKHKKIAGRNRAKKIDQKSRWVFPVAFIIFNIIYWAYYCVFS